MAERTRSIANAELTTPAWWRIASVALVAVGGLGVLLPTTYGEDCNGNGVPDAADLAPTGGGFTTGTFVAVQGTVLALDVSDLDGDSHPDFVVATNAERVVSIVWGLGGGSFSQPDLLSDSWANAVIALDLDRDGDRDLAVRRRVVSGGSLQFFENRGQRAFVSRGEVAVAEFGPRVVAIDSGSEQFPELLVETRASANAPRSQLTLLSTGGDWSFESHPIAGEWTAVDGMITGEATGDALVDVVIPVPGSGAISILANEGDGSFRLLEPFVTGGQPDRLAMGDFDGDGSPDLFVAESKSPRYQLHTREAGGPWTLVRVGEFPVSPVALLAEDFDGDGRSDIAAIGSRGGSGVSTLQVLWMRGEASPESNVYLAGSASDVPLGLFTGDFDDDGRADLAFGSSLLRRVILLFAQGASGFRAAHEYAQPGVVSGLARGDFDGDHFQDLAISSRQDQLGGISLRMGSRPGFLSNSRDVVSRPSSSLAFAVADMDGDGDLDFATVDRWSHSFSVFGNGGGAEFASKGGVTGQGRGGNVIASDLDKDGKCDFIYSLFEWNADGTEPKCGANIIRVKANGAPEVQARLRFSVLGSSGPVPVAAGDLDQDGHVDIVTGSGDSPELYRTLHLFPGVGDWQWTEPVLLETARLPVALELGDLDGDGLLEIVSCGSFGTVRVHRNEGSLRFSTVDLEFGVPTVAIALADLDVNGSLDLAVVHSGSTSQEGPNAVRPGVRIVLNDGHGILAAGYALEAVQSPQSIAVGDMDHDGFSDLAVGDTYDRFEVLLNQARTTSLDCDRDGVPDECAIESGAARDCNKNGVPDVCDLASKLSADCNASSVPDECELADGTLRDRDADGVPDVCEPEPFFHRGDANRDGEGDLTDAVFVFSYLFLGTFPPGCLEAADVDNNGQIEITDPIFFLQFQFLGGPPPVPPGPVGSPCGQDPDPRDSPLDLGCERYDACTR